MAGRTQGDDGNGGEASQAAFRTPVAGILGLEHSSTLDDERMQAYYESRPPIARGVFVKKVWFGGRLVDYYDFFGLEEPAGERPTMVGGGGGDGSDRQSGRRIGRRAREAPAGREVGGQQAAVVGGGGGGRVVVNNAMSAVGGGERGLIIRDQNNTVSQSALMVVDQEDQAAAAAAGGGEEVEEGETVSPSALMVVDQEDQAAAAAAGGGEEVEEGEIDDRPEPVTGDAPVAAVGPGAAARNGADRWVIKKKLTCSDVNGSSRLLLLNEEVVKHVLIYINEREITTEGKEVRVWDADKSVEYTMRLAKWKSSGSYLFKDGWRCTIVEKRGLKKGDTVGFYWDPIQSRFVFSVLAVAAPGEAGQGAA